MQAFLNHGVLFFSDIIDLLTVKRVQSGPDDKVYMRVFPRKGVGQPLKHVTC